MKKLSKLVLLSSILMLFINIPLNLNGNNNELATNINSNSEANSANGLGIYETLNFIPTGGNNFTTSALGDPLWTYPQDESYIDTFWGYNGLIVDGNQTQYKTVTQSLTQDNRFFTDSKTQVAGSLDFQGLGVGSLRIDPKKRYREIYSNDTDMGVGIKNHYISQNKPTPTGSYSSSWTASGGTAGSGSSNYYPGNVNSSLNFYTTNNENWIWGNIMKTPTYRIVNNGLYTNSRALEFEITRDNWWSLAWPQTTSGTRYTYTISADWDSTAVYDVELVQMFYHNGTSQSVEAFISGDVFISAVGDLSTQTLTDGSGYYNTDVSGNVTYRVYKSTGGISLIYTDPTIRTFSEEGTGTLDATDLSLLQSTDFGSYLTQGWYYLSIKVSIAVRLRGSVYESWYGRNGRVTNYSPLDNIAGVNVIIKNPKITIKESDDIKVPSEGKELLIESDWVPWGELRNVIDDPYTDPTLVFGYQIPTTLKGANGGSETLENSRVVAYLIIDRPTGQITFRNVSTYNFAQVRNLQLGYGNSCMRFIWPMNESIQGNLSGAIQIKWKIGIYIQQGLELSYYSDSYSRVYFNNINFTVTTEVKLISTFILKNSLDLIETRTTLNFGIFNNVDYFAGSTTNGSILIKGLYNETAGNPWRITVNFTYNGVNYIVYNSTYPINKTKADLVFSDTIILNLTNAIYYICDKNGNGLGENITVHLKSVSNPSDVRTEKTNSTSNVLFRGIYNGDWQLIVNITEQGENLTIYNSTRKIEPAANFPDIFLITANNQINANISNIKLTLTNSSGSLIPNAYITLQNIENPSIIKKTSTNDTGIAILREISSDSNWRIIVNQSGYITLNTTYSFGSQENIASVSKYTNLTNLELTIRDYSDNLINNVVNPIIFFSDGSTNHTKSILNGLVTIPEIWNSSSWSLLINVTISGIQYTVFNASYGVSTSNYALFNTVKVNLTNVEFTIRDSDNAIIPNAMVYLNNLDETYSQMKIADSNGKVIFREVHNLNSWNLTVKYTSQGQDAIDFTTFNIFVDGNYGLIKPNNQDYLQIRSIGNCNLTTLNFWVLNSALNDIAYALPLANVTIKSSDGSKIISTYNSSSSASISIKVPIDTYEFSVNYRSEARTFDFNESVPYNNQLTQLRLIDKANTTQILLFLTDAPTKLEVVTWNFLNPSWTNTASFNSQPYSVSMFFQDAISFTLNYSKVSGEVMGSSGLEASYWQITPLGNIGLILNSSSLSSVTIPSMWNTTDGYFNFTLNSSNYPAGTYRLTFAFINSGNYLDAFLDIIIQIVNQTTNLGIVEASSLTNVYWKENIRIWVNYTITDPFTAPANNAIITYSVAGTSISGIFDHPNLSNGLYNMSFSTNNLNIGTYRIDINAIQGNLTARNIQIYITINPLPTIVLTEINSEFRITNNSMKVSQKENISVAFNYTSLFTGLEVENAIYAVYLDNPSNNLTFYTISGNMKYNITVPANLFSIGSHILYIECKSYNQINYTIAINVEIISTWSISIEIVTPPEFTPWGNNASFIVEYTSIETPRSNRKLTGASITQLTITYVQDSVEFVWRVYNTSHSNVWGWREITETPGRYEIWFNTSVLSITSNRFFYAKPSMNHTVYSNAIPQPYVWVSPLATSIELKSDNQNINQLTMYFGEIKTIQAYLSVADSKSGLNGNLISGAQVKYEVYTLSGGAKDVLIMAGMLITRGNGLYEINLTASRLGNYLVEVTMVLTNYTLTQPATFTWSTSYTPVSFRTTIDANIR
jgi:hypothetical protein